MRPAECITLGWLEVCLSHLFVLMFGSIMLLFSAPHITCACTMAITCMRLSCFKWCWIVFGSGRVVFLAVQMHFGASNNIYLSVLLAEYSGRGLMVRFLQGCFWDFLGAFLCWDSVCL